MELIQWLSNDKLWASEGLYSADNEIFYFLANGANIYLSTGMTNASFGMAIGWIKVNTTFTPDLINLNKSDTQPKSVQIYNEKPCIVTAETRVSILIIPPASRLYLLRSIMIYDGPDWNSTCLGTGMQLWKSKRQWVSTGKQMTIQFLDFSLWDDTARIIFQDYENSKSIVQYQGIVNWQRQVVLDSSQGPSAIMINENDEEYLNTVTSLVGNGTIDVYIGGITSSQTNLIASYQVNKSALPFPQVFPGNTITYVLNEINSKATMNLTSNKYYYTSDIQPFGRKGFISSSHYMQAYTNQYVEAEINGPRFKLTTFSLVIRCADITPNTAFNLTVMNRQTVVYNEQYNMTNLPVLNQTITAIGDSLTVLFDSKNESSHGLYMNFELLKDSSNFYVFVSILITLLSIYFS